MLFRWNGRICGKKDGIFWLNCCRRSICYPPSSTIFSTAGWDRLTRRRAIGKDCIPKAEFSNNCCTLTTNFNTNFQLSMLVVHLCSTGEFLVYRTAKISKNPLLLFAAITKKSKLTARWTTSNWSRRISNWK